MWSPTLFLLYHDQRRFVSSGAMVGDGTKVGTGISEGEAGALEPQNFSVPNFSELLRTSQNFSELLRTSQNFSVLIGSHLPAFSEKFWVSQAESAACQLATAEG